VALDRAGRLRGVPLVPNAHLLVIADREERVDIKIIPCNVFNDLIVRVEVLERVLRQLVAIRRIYVPNAHITVVAAGQEQAMLMLVPCQTITLLRVTQ
jgi:hypothetical protein